jgi:hypothetical protein
MSLWEGDRLVVIEGIPARVCERCAEQFYDDATVNKIEVLRTWKFPLAQAKRVIEVGVFTLPQTGAVHLSKTAVNKQRPRRARPAAAKRPARPARGKSKPRKKI